MEEKGVVLEIANHTAIILTEHGDFQEIKVKSPVEIGQEILVPASRQSAFSTFWKRMPRVYAAAGILLVFAASLLAPSLLKDNSETVAYVGLEMMPNVELGVDKQGKVTEVITHNAQAQALVGDLQLKDRNVSEVAGELTSKAIAKGDIKPGKEKDVLITVVAVSPDKKVPDHSSKIEHEVKIAAADRLAQENIPAKVETVTADQTVRDQAQQMGLSTGEYVILQKARESGLDLEAADIKDQGVDTAVTNAGGNTQELIDKVQKEGIKTPTDSQGTSPQAIGPKNDSTDTGSAITIKDPNPLIENNGGQ